MGRKRTKVFISYSHLDRKWLDALLLHLSALERQGLIRLWTDKVLLGGDGIEEVIAEEIQDAKIAVLLVSANFLASTFIRTKEIPQILLRHEEEGMVLYPILLRQCGFKREKWLAPRNIRPHDAKSLFSMKGDARDNALVELADEIAKIAGQKRVNVIGHGSKTQPPGRSPVRHNGHGGDGLATQKSDAYLHALGHTVEVITDFAKAVPESEGKTSTLRRIHEALLRASDELLRLGKKLT